MKATAITAKSAVIRWIVPPETEAIDFKVMLTYILKTRGSLHSKRKFIVDLLQIDCKALRQYNTPDGGVESEEENVVHYVPEGVDHVLLGDLKPNCRYSCKVVRENWKDTSNSITTVHFSTLYGGQNST